MMVLLLLEYQALRNLSECCTVIISELSLFSGGTKSRLTPKG